METSLLYLILFILLFQLFVLVILSFKPKDRCCKKDCCCEGKKLCKCEEFTDVVTQLKTKSACCKDDESDCDCELPDPIEINKFPSRETTIGSLGTPENRTKTFRGISYKDKHNRDYINFLDEQERKDHHLKDSEPLEENDPNINKK